MSTIPTPDTGDTLAHRIDDHREELRVFMADTQRCDDITSGNAIPIDVLLNTVSNRRLKRDITPVDWSR